MEDEMMEEASGMCCARDVTAEFMANLGVQIPVAPSEHQASQSELRGGRRSS